MARRLSNVHDWHVAVTPPGSIIYLVYHIYLHLMYIGVTTSPLAALLKKHITDATSHHDATLHKMMLQTDIAHWGILPLQYVADPWLASGREHHWLFVFRKYACNDVAPGISTDGQESQPRGWLKQRVLAVLQGLREAKQLSDYPRMWYLHL